MFWIAKRLFFDFETKIIGVFLSVGWEGETYILIEIHEEKSKTVLDAMVVVNQTITSR